MQIKTYYGRKKRNNLSLMEMYSRIQELHPAVYNIIRQIRDAPKISKADKKMIENQLISMCGTLNEVKTYDIIYGRWRKDNVYSERRAKEVDENKTIRNETVFTIISYGKRNHWTVYIDLPIDVVV